MKWPSGIIGLIKPSFVIRFGENKSRPKVLGIYGSICLATFIGMAICISGLSPVLPKIDIEKYTTLKQKIDADVNAIIVDSSYFNENLGKFEQYAKWIDTNISPFIDKNETKIKIIIKAAKHSPDPTTSLFAIQFEYFFEIIRDLKQLNYSISHMNDSAVAINAKYRSYRQTMEIKTLEELDKEITANYIVHLKNVGDYGIAIENTLNQADMLVSKVINASEFLSDKYNKFMDNPQSSNNVENKLLSEIKNYKSKFMGSIKEFNVKITNSIKLCDSIATNLHTLNKMHEDILKYYAIKIKKEPNNSQIFYDRGVFLSRSGNLEEGLIDLKKASQMGNENAKNMLASISKDSMSE